MFRSTLNNINDLYLLQEYLIAKNFSKIFILTDTNTNIYCLPILLENAEYLADRQASLLEVSAEENKSKNINTVIDLINSLIEEQADRNSCIINLGGGLISDIGGFAASIYKRGIQAINIPTTLLSMVDASIGGKTAINHLGVKNIIGTFNFNAPVFLCEKFLKTLNKVHIKDGVDEMLKTFIVSDEELANKILEDKELNFYLTNSVNISDDISNIFNVLILKCAKIKQYIVEKDPYDKNERKKLNFGHTFAHALEAFYKGNISHGHAVAIGMYYSTILSEKKLGFSNEKADKIKRFLKKNYDILDIKPIANKLMEFIYQDKKNDKDNILFVLLSDMGICQINVPITEEDILNLC